MTDVHAVPDWVRPSAAEVFDLQWLAYRRYLDAEHEVDAAWGEAIAATVVWVWGSLIGPATGRPEQPVTRGVAVAEMWAAMAIGDGGGTPERDLRGACEGVGVRYYPPDFCTVDPERGMAMYETLCWLLGDSPGGCSPAARRPPMEIPRREAAGRVAEDSRSRELAALVDDTRARAAASLNR